MPLIGNPYEKYKQQGVQMANPVELIIMLYDGCIKRLKLARIAIEDNHYQEANKNLQKANAIIMELLNSLELRYPIAGELMKIYEFMLSKIREINASKDAGEIEPVIEMLVNLRKSWTHVLKENKLIENIG